MGLLMEEVVVTATGDGQSKPTPTRFSYERKPYHKKLFKTPKEATAALMTAGESKAAYGPLRLVTLGILAGLWVGIAAHGGSQMAAVFQPLPSGDSIIVIAQAQRMMFGITIPIGLVTLIVMGSELFTGNTMTLIIPLFARRITWYRFLYNLGGVLIGNFAGCVMIAYFLTYGSGLVDADPWKSYMVTTLERKTDLSFQHAYVRGLGANAWVCAAVYLAIASEDISAKFLCCTGCIFMMAVSGWEHLIINAYTLCIGLIIGESHVTFGDVVLKNLIPVFLGNMSVGFLIGGLLYFLYLHGDIVPPQPNVTNATPKHPEGETIPAKTHWRFHVPLPESMKCCVGRCRS